MILNNVHDYFSPRILVINRISVIIILEHTLYLLYCRALTSYKLIQQKSTDWLLSTSKMEVHLKAWKYDTLISGSVRVEPGLLNFQNLILQLLKPLLQERKFNHFWWAQSFSRDQHAGNIHSLKRRDSYWGTARREWVLWKCVSHQIQRWL